MARSPAAELLNFLRADTRNVELRNSEARCRSDQGVAQTGCQLSSGRCGNLSWSTGYVTAMRRCGFLRTKAARKHGLPIAAQPETLAISSTQRSREIAFVAMLAPPPCFLVSVKIAISTRAPLSASKSAIQTSRQIQSQRNLGSASRGAERVEGLPSPDV